MNKRSLSEPIKYSTHQVSKPFRTQLRSDQGFGPGNGRSVKEVVSTANLT